MKRITLLFAFLVMSIGWAAAQSQVEVSGTVISAEDNQPIIGAAVRGKVSKQGTQTNIDGKFKFNVPASEKVLVISYVGMKPREVAVGKDLRIVLEPEESILDEVVVVAFGQAKKSGFTGSVKQINSEELSKSQVSNVTRALEGRIPGVSVSSSNNQPGTSATLSIRGVGSFSAGTGPLYVVDGVPFSGDISSINPQDIESTSVLKDAASAALYGARGANGVILIQTKSGSKDMDKMQVSFEARYGVNQRGVSDYDVIRDPKVYAAKYFEGIYNSAMKATGATTESALTSANTIYFATDGTTNLVYHPFTAPDGAAWFTRGANGYFTMNPDITVGTQYNHNGNSYWLQPDNWSDEVFSTNPRQEYNLALSGRSAKASYYVSTGYLNDKGYVVGSAFERFTARLRGDFSPTNWMKVGANIAYTYYISNMLSNTEEGGNSGNIFAMTNFAGPLYPVYVRNADKSIMYDKHGIKVYDFGTGEYSGLTRPFLNLANPLALYNLDKQDSRADIVSAKGFVDFTFIEGLKLTLNVGADIDNTWSLDRSNVYYGQFAASGGSITRQTDRTASLNAQQLATYIKNFGQHSVDFLLGHEFYQSWSNNLYGIKGRLYHPEADELNGAIHNPRTGSSSAQYATEGYLGRAQYNYAMKYFAQASFRRDSSSRFRKESRWGNFWSLGASWVINREDFMQDYKFIDMLKLKASFGMQGNDAIGNFRYMDLYSLTNANDQYSIKFSTKGNPDVTWETSANFNVGLEFALFKNRISGGIDVYSREVSDMLMTRRTPNSIGYGSYMDNVGSMRNTGVEFELSGDILRGKDYVWSLTVNGGFFKNTLTKLPSEWEEIEGGYRDGSSVRRVGGSIYDRIFAHYGGVDEQGRALYEYYDATEKAYKFTHEYDKVEENIQSKRIYTDVRPMLTGGITTSATYKAFDFSLSASYSLGGRMYDATYQRLMHGGTDTGSAWHKDILNSWTPENKTNIPMVDYSGKYMSSTSDRFLVSRSYLALNNVTLGYTLPKSLLEPMSLTSARVYVVADNLALFSARKGLDPRFGSGVGYKSIRSLSAGIRVTL